MGFNTVAVLLNDGLDVGAKDSSLGSRILDASRAWASRNDPRRGGRSGLDFFARSENHSASYGSIISQDHADGYQVVIVHGNMGWRADDASYDKYLGWMAFETMKECLERNGYTVTKTRKKRADPKLVNTVAPEPPR